MREYDADKQARLKYGTPHKRDRFKQRMLCGVNKGPIGGNIYFMCPSNKANSVKVLLRFFLENNHIPYL